MIFGDRSFNARSAATLADRKVSANAEKGLSITSRKIGAVAAIQFAGLGWLAWIGWMSAATAYTALGGACALTGAVWLYLACADFAIRRNQVRPAMERSWDLGKWLFAGQIAVSVQVYVTYWLLALRIGPTATGVYATCMSIVSFATPLISGFVNSLRPTTALAF